MSRRGGTTAKFYRETRGLKISDGQSVITGTILTRQGNKWRPGINVSGRSHVFALCDGTIYFTKKKGAYNKTLTYINIKPDKKAKQPK